MAVLTIVMVLAMQDTRLQVHEDPKPVPGTVQPRRIFTPAAVSVNEPRRRAASPVAPRPRVTDLPVNGPPADRRPIRKTEEVEAPQNGDPRGRRPRPRATPTPGPPPPPPMPVSGPQPVRPSGLPQNWVTNDDYPSAMMRAHTTGQVAFELDIDTAGRPIDCRILSTSGSSVLDTTTCALARRRGRFIPARDATGTAVPAKWSSRFNWSLPDTALALGSWARVVRFVVDKDGAVLGCAVAKFGQVPAQAGNPCLGGDAWRLKQAHGTGEGPMAVSFVEVHRVDGMPMPVNFAAPVGREVFVRTIGFDVGVGGAIRGCAVSETAGLNLLSGGQAAYDCHTGLLYLMPSGVRSAKGSYIIRITAAPTTIQPLVPAQ